MSSRKVNDEAQASERRMLVSGCLVDLGRLGLKIVQIGHGALGVAAAEKMKRLSLDSTSNHDAT
jgi:hypothetical protein